MRPRIRQFFIGLSVLALRLYVGALDQAHAGSLSNLPTSAQSGVSAALGRDMPAYFARPAHSGFYAANRRQKLTIRFRSQNVEVQEGNVRWVLALSGYGYGEALKHVRAIAPRASSNRVEYLRDSLTEWYVNGPVGLEQGFTLSHPPGRSDGQPLTIALALSGDLKGAIDQKGTGLSLAERDQRPLLQYAGLSAHDALGKELPSWLELHGTGLLLRVQDGGAKYPVVIDPLVQSAKLTASDGVPGDQMGISIGICGNTIVVGAQNATVGSNTAQGAAYVFVKKATGWADMTETAKLTASDGMAGDGFGGAVGISGNTIVVGACNQSGMCNLEGKVYVFLRPQGGWQTTSQFKAELTASDGQPNDGFSNNLSISRDGKTVVVGAWNATIGSKVGQGAAYVFTKPSSGWKTMNETAKLTEPYGAAYDDFGNVSVSADGSTVFAGAFQLKFTAKKTIGKGPGKAYIFVRPVGGWKTTSKAKAKLTAPDGVTGDSFGFCQAGSVCISADGTTVLAAAPQTSSTSTGAGKAYVFVRPASGWATTSDFAAELSASDGQRGDFLGWSAAITNNRAVIGAVVGNAVYVFGKPKSGWQTTSNFNAKLAPADGTRGAFGFSAATSGNTIAVGAFNSPGGGKQGPGAAFVFGP